MQNDIAEIEEFIRKLELVQITEAGLLERLSTFINNLIVNNFEGLISVLYRVDINEEKLRELLSENNGTESAKIIAAIIIDRQLEKIKSRQKNRRDNRY